MPDTPCSFTINLTNDPTHTIRFENHKIFIGGRFLTEDNQKQFLQDYENAYRMLRRRNYGWRFLSFCHDYFNGQLQEIRNKNTDEEKIRYLFCHAERTPYSKTAEALKHVLPIFCALLHPSIRTVAAPTKQPPTMPHSRTQSALFSAATVAASSSDRAEYPQYYMQCIEQAFYTLWKCQSISTVIRIVPSAKNSGEFYLFFASNFQAALEQSSSWVTCYTPFKKSLNAEVAICEWAQQLYNALADFRQQVCKAKGVTKEIHRAFGELMIAIHKEPALIAQHGEFYEGVKSLRMQVSAIHQDWRKSIEDEMISCHLLQPVLK